MTAFCISLGNRHESAEKPCQLKGTKSEPSSNYFGLESRKQSRTNPKANSFKKDLGLHNNKAFYSLPKHGYMY